MKLEADDLIYLLETVTKRKLVVTSTITVGFANCIDSSSSTSETTDNSSDLTLNLESPTIDSINISDSPS